MNRKERIEELLTSPDLLSWLQGWYFAHCNGDWEHNYGPSITPCITTIDNSGWTVSIALTGTRLETVPFELLFIEREEHDWVHCKVEQGYFVGYGGPGNLIEVINQFREWANPYIVIADFLEIDLAGS